MSKKPKEIRNGLLYLGRGEYSSVIRLLESKIPLFLENKEFYVILAKAFYYTGDNAGAKLYFDRGQKIHWDVDSALYLAALGLKRRDYNSSLRIWLDILDEDPNNKMAKKGLASLKKYSTMDELESFIHSKKVDRLIPRKKIKLAVSTIITLYLLLFLAAVAFIGIKANFIGKFLEIKNVQDNTVLENSREGNDQFKLDDLNSEYLDFSNQSIFSFSGSQIEDYFKSASSLFMENKDNKVRTYLNLIKYSNASEQVKQKAIKLESYLVEPNWVNYSDEITFMDVSSSLYEYENCVVKWRGMLSNLEIKDRKIHFSFLVGYDNGKILDGVVPVELNENVKLQENQPIEVLGRVVRRDDTFYLEALTVMHYVIRNK
ncbi:MAG: hypothetical protein OCD02_21120 [Spirochaetaceae bacterium]